MVEHAVTISRPDGSSIRLGPDEENSALVPTNLSLETELPGGFGPATVTLPSSSALNTSAISLFDGVRIYEATNNQTFHEGRLVGISQAADGSVTLEIEGWAKHLEDDNTARAIFMDRDLSSWQGMSVQRQLDLVSALGLGISDGSSTNDPTNGASAMETGIDGDWSASQAVEAWYDAGNLPIGGLDFAWLKNDNVDWTDTNWAWYCGLTSDDFTTPGDNSGNLRAVGPDSGTVTSTTTNTFAFVNLTYSGAGGTSGARYSVFWTLLGVFGNHGLTLQGSVNEPNTGRGLLVSDMARYIVTSFAPLLKLTGNSVQPTAFIVPHSAFKDNTNAKAMLDSLVLLGGNDLYPLDYGVYEDRTFFLAGPSSYGDTWYARRDQATESADDGPDSTTRLNGVKVTYDDGTGTTRSVGPPGTFSTFETPDLQDTSPDNPANNDGARHYAVYDAGITTQGGAVLIGQMILADANRQEWRGSITVHGEVMNAQGLAPVAMVRAGDRIVIEDDHDPRPRRVVSTSYDPGTVTASIGAPPDHLDTLLARLGVVLTGRL